MARCTWRRRTLQQHLHWQAQWQIHVTMVLENHFERPLRKELQDCEGCWNLNAVRPLIYGETDVKTY